MNQNNRGRARVHKTRNDLIVGVIKAGRFVERIISVNLKTMPETIAHLPPALITHLKEITG
ncbi:MAG: hypothetical protein J0652_01585 [Desulfobulbaceae bacterium]|nr:hypothetical protein [Desulfobulbaceae bacterium]